MHIGDGYVATQKAEEYKNVMRTLTNQKNKR